MAVETYLEGELEELVVSPEINEEWKQKIEELGLSGQKQLLVCPTKSPIPFPHMNQAMIRTYDALCPLHEELSTFNRSTIPLRVLSIAALCKQEGYFKLIEVWSDNEKPDPILVGHKEGKYNSDDKYILARWGDELRSYIELQQIALKRKIQENRLRLENEISDRKNTLEAIENKVEQWMGGGWIQNIQ